VCGGTRNRGNPPGRGKKKEKEKEKEKEKKYSLGPDFGAGGFGVCGRVDLYI
jgi:hypothetical protein